MLSYRLLRNHAGILLMGDYESLVQLHEIVHDVNERSPLIEDEDGAFLGLAYDVRKAYEQQREVIPPPNEYEEIGTRFGVEILWPVLMVQQRLLRVSLAYMDHSKRHFADLLESFDPMYPSLYLARLAQGQQVDALAPEALDAWANQEWVDPRW